MRGAWGELAACAFLERRGYRIEMRNFRTRFGEIDMIAVQGQYIVCVEVKTRKADRFAAAREVVTPQKQEHILAAAQEWLQSHPTRLQPRFDAAAVFMPGDAPARIEYLENVFFG